MAVQNGPRCLACCLALQATLFALGVMNVTWMAFVAAVFVAAVVATEKTFPVAAGHPQVAPRPGSSACSCSPRGPGYPGLTVPAGDEVEWLSRPRRRATSGTGALGR